MNFHARLKPSRLDHNSSHSYVLYEVLIQALGLVGFRRTIEIWTAALSAFPVNGELRNNKQSSIRFNDTSIHFTVLIGKDPQPGDFCRKKFGVVFRIFLANAQQNQQTGVDGAHNRRIHDDAGFRDSLNNGAHQRECRRSLGIGNILR